MAKIQISKNLGPSQDMKNLPNEVSDIGLNFNAAKFCT